MSADRCPTAPTAPTELSTASAFAEHGLAIAWVFPQPLVPSTPLKNATVLGRSASCDVVIPSNGTSRKHAEIQRQGPLWVISDCKSRNGTFVNGEAIGFAPLEEGDVIRIGGHVGVVRPAREQVYLSELAPGLWGGDVLNNALEEALTAAKSKLPIIITGETGTGKERVARAIHHKSGRRGPFVAINCGAISPQLAEAELFGHVKGAFTGAVASSLGSFRAADQGTLFLDEVTELSPSIQTKLLRALQEKEVAPVGSTKTLPIDVRILAASHQSPKLAVEQNTFRQDLYMRLAGLELELPRLSDRIADIPMLFSRFVVEHAEGRPSPSVEPKLVEALCVYDWPGNVRQLEMLAQRLLSLIDGDSTLKRSSLPEELQVALPADKRLPSQQAHSRKTYDLERLTQALRQTNGNLAAAAKSLKLSRQRAYRILDGRTPRSLLEEA